MNVHELTIKYLNQVLFQHQQMQKAVKTIRSMRYRKIGLSQVAMSDEDRKMMIVAAKRKGIEQCSKVYTLLNQERQTAGFPKLTNPYSE